MTVPRLLVALVVLGAASSCAPWYRDDELRALRADDTAAMTARLAECDELVGQGRAPNAADCFESALERNPADGRGLVGLARSLVSAGRHAEARAAAEQGLRALPPGSDPASQQALGELIVESYAREQLWALVLERASERGAPDLEKVASQYPAVFGKLAEAKQAAVAGDSATALEHYAAWLAHYGVPDQRVIRGWCDDVLWRTAPRLAATVERADREAAAGNWIGAVVAYGAAFRYLPAKTFDEKVRSKLVAAAAHVVDASWLSPTAVDAATEGRALVQRGETGTALRAHRRAVAAAPYWAEAHHDLAVLQASLGMLDEAVAQMDWFLTLAPGSPLHAKARALRDGWAARRGAKAGEKSP
jgi:tetratricopeptide (TPR) repeat protein